MAVPTNGEPAGNERAFRVLPWISFAVLILVFLGTLWVVVSQTTTNAGLDAQKRSDDVAQCSRRLRGPIDTADAELERSATTLDLMILAGLRAVAEGDDDALAEVVSSEPSVRAAVAKAQAKKDKAAKDYDDASHLPVEQFLAECRARGD